MSKIKATADPSKRHKTRYRGITYRVPKGGGKTYSVYHAGRYWLVEGGEQEALALQAELRGKGARKETLIKPTNATFSEIAERWYESKERRLRPWTLKSYRDALDRVLIPRFGTMKITALTVDHVAKLIRELEDQGLSTSTISTYLLPLAGTCTLAVRRGLIAVNPYLLLTVDDRPRRKARKQDHEWSDEEVKALLDAAEYLAKQPESRYDYSLLLRTAVCTGLRLGELLGLTWADVDLEGRAIDVRRQWSRLNEYAEPKTEAALRRVPLSDEMTRQLAALKLRSRFSQDADPVFAARNGKPLQHRNTTRRGFEPAAKHAEIDGVTFHSLRHAFASRMIHRGIEPVRLASLLGHEDARVTLQRYTHVYNARRGDDLVREAMALEA